jgi:hypothetical protein
MCRFLRIAAVLVLLFPLATVVGAQETRGTALYAHFKSLLDAVPAIDTHDHLRPFEQIPASPRHLPDVE